MARSALHRHAETQPAGETAAQQLAAYATALRFEDLPAAAVERAKHCLVDAIGCVIFGQRFPWSAMVLDEGLATGAGGPCRLPGVPDKQLHVPQAALTLGAFCHAFELDSLSKPSLGVHPGATVALPAFAMAQATGASGGALIAAIVAGCEVMFRIGAATHHTPEKLGFHAPGITGPFGAAAACASLMRLSADEAANAFGIAGSFAGSLLAFAKAGSGGMIKRLHLGRAAEGGVLAARLAQRGYEGPPNVLEGRYGVLEAFCEDYETALLTKGLGQRYEIERLCLKSYGLHVTAQAPVQLLRGWIAEHKFSGDDIATLALEGSEKVLSHHTNADPADVMQAQYSVPFSVALSAYHDPLDPAVFSDRTIGDPRVRELAKRIHLSGGATVKGWGTRMRLTLRDGCAFEAERDSFLGCPETPMSAGQLRLKFDKLTQDSPAKVRQTLFDNLMRIEHQPTLNTLTLS
jgi:2-methylcitrate dehydratase PrpD